MGKNLEILKRATTFLLLVVLVLSIGSSAWGSKSNHFDYPLKSKEVVQKFQEPTHLFGNGHRGVDFKAPKGTKVFASANGQVIFAGLVSGGLHISIDHGGKIVSTSTFLDTKNVKAGDVIKRGELIGTTSGGGPWDTPNSFHFSMRVDGKYVDPLTYLNGKIEPRDIYLAPFDEKNKSLLESIFERERKALSALIRGASFVIDKATGLPLELKDHVWKGLVELSEQATNAANKAQDLISQMKEVAKQITIDTARGATELAKKGIEKLKSLEKLLVSSAKDAFILLAELSQFYGNLYREALSYGIESAKLFLNYVKEYVLLNVKLASTLALGLYDLVDSQLTTALKILNQFVELDLPTLLRAIVVPGSCLLATCVRAVKMKCNVNGKFAVKKRGDGYKGSGNGVFVVSGLRSKGEPDPVTKEIGNTAHIPVDILGYDKNEVMYYSYGGLGKSFDRQDTYGDIHVMAKRMDDQIRDYKKKNPGKKLDLLSHSLGGAVAGVWIANHYDPKDKAYPELGKVIMYAPPLSGTGLATGGEALGSSSGSKKLHDVVGGLTNMPTSDAKILDQLKEDGEIDGIISSSDKFKKLDVYAIRSSADWIVTAASDPVDGVEEIIYNELVNDTAHPSTKYGVKSVLKLKDSHFKVTTDVKSVATVQALLEGKLPPCESFSNAIKSIPQSAIVHASEVTFGRTLRDYSSTAEAVVNDTKEYVSSFSGR